LALFGVIIRFGLSDGSSSGSSSGSDTEVPQGPYEIVQASHDGASTVPAQIALQAGRNYEVQITPQRNGLGCFTTATVPKLGREVYPVRAWQTFSIKVTNAKSGRYPIVCASMWMQEGEIVVQ